jgi:hypothetical protein
MHFMLSACKSSYLNESGIHGKLSNNLTLTKDYFIVVIL